ncbi:MAG: DUF1801 domain-containing protein [Candidatus Moraniibacteriota bacterium]|nr:MAG: DUF1801 domain-containing protein [Candidatus Moranbacteria bacterium]
MAMKKSVESVSDYISAAPAWARPILRELRRVIRTAAPKAKESISYQMPYYALDGRVAYFGAYQAHCSFHWISSEDKREFSNVLAKARVVGSTLQIPKGEKVPTTLIRRIVQAHVRRNLAKKKK